MAMDLLSLVDMPSDSWCKKYICDGNYLPVTNSLWGIRSSTASGLTVRQVVAMRAGEPYITLWPWHWRLILEQLPRIGVSEIEFSTSENLRREIWLLATRNRYPAHSLAHIVIWLEDMPCGRQLRHAIFQSRLPKSIFDISADHPLNLMPPSRLTAVNDTAGSWADATIEALATNRAKTQQCDGACLTLPNGNLARTTLGNIFFFLPGGRVIGSNRGSRPDALCQFVQDKDLFGHFNFKYEEVEGFSQHIITDAVECFICDATIGLQPVMSLGTTKRFRRTATSAMADELRRLVTL